MNSEQRHWQLLYNADIRKHVLPQGIVKCRHRVQVPQVKQANGRCAAYEPLMPVYSVLKNHKDRRLSVFRRRFAFRLLQ